MNLAAPVAILLLSLIQTKAVAPSMPATLTAPSELENALKALKIPTVKAESGGIEYLVKRNGDLIRMTASLSSSRAKIWFMASYGKLTEDELADPDYLRSILEKNAEIQPAQMVIRKGALTICLAIDNRGLTPLVLKRAVESFTDAAIATKLFWQSPPS